MTTDEPPFDPDEAARHILDEADRRDRAELVRTCAMCGQECTGAHHTIAGLPPEHEFHVGCLRPPPIDAMETVYAIIYKGKYTVDVAALQAARDDWDRRYRERWPS